ncbi:MAG: hypothetical protein HQL94_08975 [Magnetococcales bacterium]|nr:hypothetical protein [Magnetococcales bacterium]
MHDLLILLVGILGLLFGAGELQAHGPGRALRVEMGYCEPESAGMVRDQHLNAQTQNQELPFCFRIHNQEPFSVTVNLRFLPGLIIENGTEVCQMTDASEPLMHKHFFLQADKKHPSTSLVLDPTTTQEIRGQWVYQAGTRFVDKNIKNRQAMVNCILGEASPLERLEQSHQSGVHLKGRRGMHMVHVEGP